MFGFFFILDELILETGITVFGCAFLSKDVVVFELPPVLAPI